MHLHLITNYAGLSLIHGGNGVSQLILHMGLLIFVTQDLSLSRLEQRCRNFWILGGSINPNIIMHEEYNSTGLSNIIINYGNFSN